MLKKSFMEEDVLQAAKIRVEAIFRNSNNIVLSISGGKDSIVLSDIIYRMCVSGKADASKLTVIFIDEEAMFDEVIDIVKHWRQKFLEVGAKFEWYCIEVKHFNCLNSLADDETFICWDRRKKDVWVRQMPRFAITDHKMLIPRKDSYQDYMERRAKVYGETHIVGLRCAESIQRLKSVAAMQDGQTKQYPIYDMTDTDIWLYIKRYELEFPAVYENLYRIGTPKNRMRISQFFSIDTAKTLVTLGEMYPDLMARVTSREPNAYLCLMYWDTEMFGRSTRKRRDIEKGGEQVDYKKLLIDLFSEKTRLESKSQIKTCNKLRKLYLMNATMLQENTIKKMYQTIITGDPKDRHIRAVYNMIGQDTRRSQNE